MTSPVLLTFIQYGGATLSGIIIGLIFKASFNKNMQNKLRKYQMDLVKSQSLILQLESENRNCKKHVTELEGRYSTNRLFMN